MTLLAFVIPLAVIILAAIVAHSVTRKFWYSCLGVTVFTLVAYFAYLVVLDGLKLHMVRVSGIAGVFAFVVAAIVGVPFVLDRHVQKRDKAQGKW